MSDTMYSWHYAKTLRINERGKRKMTHKLTRLLALMLAVIMTFSMLLVPVEAASRYRDVSDRAWYKEAVDYVSERGWMTGVSETYFAPNAKVTRAMFVTVLARYAEAEVNDDNAAFADTPAGKWYTGAAAWAAENGITSGIGDNMFGPDRNITRQDMATMLYKFIEKQNINLSRKENHSFTDRESVSAYALTAADYCADVGLISGFEDNTFRPKTTATRAQLAQILMRMDKLVKEKPVQYFDGEADDKMSVSVYAPQGTLPENTTMTTSRVTDEAALAAIQDQLEGNVLAAADITFLKDEAEIEPDGEVEVLISLKQVICSDNLHVYHVKADGTVEPVDSDLFDIENQTRAGSDKTVRFFAKDFSVYVVVDDPLPQDDSRVLVKFHKYNTTSRTYENHASAYVKNSDELKPETGEVDVHKSYIQDVCPDPGIGDLDGSYIFTGWYIDKTGDGPVFTAETTPSTIKDVWEYLDKDGWVEGDVLNIYAMCFKYYKITFYGEDPDLVLGYDVALYLDTANPATAKYTPTMLYSPHVQNAAFEGWLAVEDEEGHANIQGHTSGKLYENNKEIVLTGDVVFNVSAPIGYWLVYDNNGKGANYVAPKFIKGEGDQVTEVPGVDMERNGYTFDGWYELLDDYVDENYDPKSTVPKDDDEKLIINDDTLYMFKEFEFGHKLSHKTIIYAKWKMNDTADYTVVFWTQKADLSGYDLKQSVVVKNQTVNQTTAYTVVEYGSEWYVRGAFTSDNNDHWNNLNDIALPANHNNPVYGEADSVYGHYKGFCLNTEKSEAPQVIRAEGDTVLNLYYDRIHYNFRFYLYRDGTTSGTYDYANNSANSTGVSGIVSWHTNQSEHPSLNGYTINGQTVTVQEENIGGRIYHYFVMPAYYGEDISGKWPGYDKINGANNRDPVSYVMMVGTIQKPDTTSSGSGTVKGLITELNEKILGDTSSENGNYVVIRFPGGTVYNWRYHIWYEAIDENSVPANKPTQRFNNKLYYEDTVLVVRSSNQDISSQNPPEYQGFATAFKVDQNFTTTGNDNSIRWTDDSDDTRHVNMVYDRLAFAVHFMDGEYVDGDENHIENHAVTTLADTSKAPYSLTILQGQDISAFTFTYEKYFEEDENGERVLAPRSYYEQEFGGKTIRVECPQPGYVFEGWYADGACNVPYDFTTMPVGGVQVYAKWRLIQYRVFLQPEADDYDDLYWGNSNQKMNFRISYGKKVSTPDGQTQYADFMGWTLEDGSPFDAKSVPLTEDFVTDDYDKNTELTDTIDIYGHLVEGEDQYNSDLTGWKFLEVVEEGQDPVLVAHDRYWITKKLVLVAHWSNHLPGANGVNLEYDIGEYGKYEVKDDLLYRPNGSAAAQASPSVKDEYAEDYVFDHWVVQKFKELDAEGKPVYEDTDVVKYPGETFTVKDKDAYVEVLETSPVYQTDDEGHILEDEDGNPIIDHEEITKAKYTVRVRAEYVPLNPAKPTHIHWVANGGKFDTSKSPAKLGDSLMEASYTVNGTVYQQDNLDINEAVPIADPPTRDGYDFLGWARVENNELSYTGPADPVDPTKYVTPYVNAEGNQLSENDLFVEYRDGKYYYNNSTASQVAADEEQPYHIMYAVWGRSEFYVFHSSSGLIQAFEVPIKQVVSEQETHFEAMPFDITALVADGYLYGGYYSTYGGVDMEEVQNAIDARGENEWNSATLLSGSWTETAELNTAGTAAFKFKAYDGKELKNGSTRYWTKADAYNVDNLPQGKTAADINGKTMKPVSKAIYYLKEVPADIYLNSEYAFVLTVKEPGTQPDPGSDDTVSVDALYLLSVIDDSNYKTTGYKLGEDYEEASADDNAITSRTGLGATLTLVQMGNSTTDATVNVIKPTDLCGQRGYLSIYHYEEVPEDPFAMIPAWTTLDGVDVTNDPLSVTVGTNNVTNEPIEIPAVTEKIYVDCGCVSWWLGDGATMKIESYGSAGNTWETATRVEGTNYFCFDKRDGQTGFRVFRYDSTGSTFWNKSVYIGFDSNKNFVATFGVAPDGSDGTDNAGVTWKTYIP